MMESIKQHLHRAQQRMKKHADKHRSERTFNVGDLVFLLQPYVQASLAPRAHQKLSFRYFGPYKVLSRIGSVAYELELSASSTVHLVFHVSLLKPAPQKKQALSPLPDYDDGLQFLEAILQRRMHNRGTSTISSVIAPHISQPPEGPGPRRG
jgi:hypothetical protein